MLEPDRRAFRLVGAFACLACDTRVPLWLTGGLNRNHPVTRGHKRARDFGSERDFAAEDSG